MNDVEKLVVDTNVLIDTPEVLLDGNYHYVIPYKVLSELDGLKKNVNLSYAVRNAIKIIYQQMKNGRVEITDVPDLSQTPDEIIIDSAKKLECALLTQDIGAMAVARSKNVAVIEDDDDVDLDGYTGYIEVTADISYENYVPLKEMLLEELEVMFDISVPINGYLIINRLSGKQDIWKYAREFDSKTNEEVRKAKRVSQSAKPFKDAGVMITPIDAYQMVAWDSVISDVPLTILEGKVGSSKTLSALVGLLACTIGQKRLKKFNKIYYSRAPIPVDKSLELGFMPGPQPLHSTVFTPSGKKKMGDMKIGDEVLTPSGVSKVTKVLPNGERPVYRITISDGTIVEAADTHIWNIELNGKSGRLYDTLDLRYLLKQSNKLFLPSIEPVQFTEKNFILAPYFVGAMLGDDYSKVPLNYLYGSINQRTRLLLGAIITNGTIISNNEVIYDANSRDIANAIKTLANSLGGSAEIHKSNKKYIVRITGLLVDKEFTPTGEKRYITAIEFKGVEEVQCISIDSDEHLYLTDGFVPTHNSMDEKALQWIAGISSNLKFLFGEEKGGEILNEHFEFVSLESIQGLSLQEDEALLIDEYQFLSRDMLQQALSRVGQNGKVILAGDPATQTYGINRSREGFKVLQKEFGKTNFISYVQLNNIYRSELVEYIDNLFNGSK